MKKFFLITISVLILSFSLKSYSLNIEDYYSSSQPEYYSFFIKKLLDDPEFISLHKYLSSDPKMAVFLKLWLEQVSNWSFIYNSEKKFFFEIYYELSDTNRNLKLIVFNFSDPINFKNTLKKCNMNISTEKSSLSLYFDLEKNKPSTTKPILIKNILIKKYDHFPHHYFIKKTEPFEFYFKKWRLPIDRLIFKDNKPWGFVLP